MTRRSAILTNLLLSLPMMTGLLGAAPSASAQTNRMTITIPFEFLIGNHHLAAGFYSVERISDNALLVRNNKSSRGVLFPVGIEQGPALESRSYLTFLRDGRSTYLKQASFAGTSLHMDTGAKVKRGQEYAGATPSTIEVASK